MASTVSSIWDDPVVEHVQTSKYPKTPRSDSDDCHSPRPTKRARATLFLPGSDDEDSDADNAHPVQQPPPEREIDIDAIFADSDDENGGATYTPLPNVDADELERQIEARHKRSQPLLTPHQVMPSSSPARDGGGDDAKKKKGKKIADDEDKKTRRKPLVLNENLLLSPRGFPQLIKETKGFKIKGKGHEVRDLNRLLQIYQFWTHQLYPKTQFRDTTTRIEKLCHSRRMVVALSVWRDEAKGIHHKQPSDDDDEVIEVESASRGGSEGREQQSAMQERRTHSPASSPAPSRPPSSASEYDIFDDDIDALLLADATSTASMQPGRPEAEPAAEEDDLFWAELDEIASDSVNALPKPPPAPTDDDEEMQEIIREIEAESLDNGQPSDVPAQGPAPMTVDPPPPADIDDWEDMYV